MPEHEVVAAEPGSAEAEADSPRVLVSDLMTREVLAVRIDCSLTAAMNAVLGSGHSHVVVVDTSGTLRGVLRSDRVATAMMTRLAKPGEIIGALIAGDPPRIAPDAQIRVAAGAMLDLEIDALGVVDADGTLLGLLTWSDIGRMVAGQGRA